MYRSVQNAGSDGRLLGSMTALARPVHSAWAGRGGAGRCGGWAAGWRCVCMGGGCGWGGGCEGGGAGASGPEATRSPLTSLIHPCIPPHTHTNKPTTPSLIHRGTHTVPISSPSSWRHARLCAPPPTTNQVSFAFPKKKRRAGNVFLRYPTRYSLYKKKPPTLARTCQVDMTCMRMNG